MSSKLWNTIVIFAPSPRAPHFIPDLGYFVYLQFDSLNCGIASSETKTQSQQLDKPTTSSRADATPSDRARKSRPTNKMNLPASNCGKLEMSFSLFFNACGGTARRFRGDRITHYDTTWTELWLKGSRVFKSTEIKVLLMRVTVSIALGD